MAFALVSDKQTCSCGSQCPGKQLGNLRQSLALALALAADQHPFGTIWVSYLFAIIWLAKPFGGTSQMRGLLVSPQIGKRKKTKRGVPSTSQQLWDCTNAIEGLLPQRENPLEEAPFLVEPKMDSNKRALGC